MKIPSRTFKGLAIAAAATLALTACSSGGNEAEPSEGGEAGLSLMTEGQLTVCSDIPYEPFEFTDENGEIVGFDIDIATEIAADQDVELSIIDDSFEGIQSGISLNKCDVSISSISITEERKGNMDFSDPYMEDDLVLIAPEGTDITDLESAQDKRIAVQAGTTGETFGQENGLQTIGFDDSGLQIQALKAGTVDAALGNISVLGYAIKDETGFVRVEEIETGEQLGVSIKKGNTEMADAVNGTLQRMEESGELGELEAQWFGEAE
ncbi:ABC transporter substrate-binding protein [Zhihengliuella salsuginis]|uniref:Basic amino acid ABC transporter substrate-binding protein n=1 Tax=Zhihengliuella salsuginis TaxID=578222 RepID=A0ABQ3GLF2_9MICC|nr:ABC transporter substrate-binding protein [Zhihengliuella salsuginis]GHD10238.1 basic amino acid ABC transporter substrate-binding protein [Zhihengliuella salsuginis]